METRFCKFFPKEVACVNAHCTYSGCYWYFVHRGKLEQSAARTLFYHNDALPQTKSGCVNYHKKALILKPEAMDRLGIERSLLYQIVIPDLGPGLFPNNPCGFIDVKLFANRSDSYTIYRNEVYGAASPLAIERYDYYYDLGLARFLQVI